MKVEANDEISKTKLHVQEWTWTKGLDRLLRSVLGKAQVRALGRTIGNYVHFSR